jgi:hypothetical protein
MSTPEQSKLLPGEHFRKVAERLLQHTFEEYQRWQEGGGDASTFLDWVRDEMRTIALGTFCCICKEPCVKDPPSLPERWHWGPDGMNCHFRCETEFRRRHPELLP